MNRPTHAAVRLWAAAVATVAGFSAGIAVAQQPISEMPGIGPSPKLPEPDPSASVVNFSRVIGWPEGRGPAAPEGFEVEAFGAHQARSTIRVASAKRRNDHEKAPNSP